MKLESLKYLEHGDAVLEMFNILFLNKNDITSEYSADEIVAKFLEEQNVTAAELNNIFETKLMSGISIDDQLNKLRVMASICDKVD